MSDDRVMPGYAGHSHERRRYATPVMELDGVPVAVSVDHDAVLWTCDLREGGCVSRSLDLDAAGPDDDWYVENGYRDPEDEEDDDFPENPIKVIVDPGNIAAEVTVAHFDGRPVVVTGGARFDFSLGDDDDSSGGIVRAWDLRTGRRVGRVMIGHDLGVCSLTTVLSKRGLLSVSSCETGKLLAWELATGAPVAEIQGSYNGVMDAAFIDGRTIAATGGVDDFIRVWDLLTGEQVGQPLIGIERVVRAIAITRMDDRAVVVAGGDDTMLHVWDLATQEPIGPPLNGHTAGIHTVGTATVAGRTLAVTGSHHGSLGDGTTRVWDLTRGQQIGDPLSGHHLQTVTEVGGMPVAVIKDPHDAIRLLDLTVAAR